MTTYTLKDIFTYTEQDMNAFLNSLEYNIDNLNIYEKRYMVCYFLEANNLLVKNPYLNNKSFRTYMLESNNLIELHQNFNKIKNYNIAVSTLGLDIVNDYIQNVNKTYNLPFVSVGSGDALLESNNKNVNWICVDPKPEEYMKDRNKGNVYLKPKYAYVKDLVDNEPNLVNNVVLFINWAYPGLDYDYEAIKILNPVAILVIYDQNGVAGGLMFHDWIPSSYSKENEYNILYETNESAEDMLYASIVWLNRSDVNVDLNQITLTDKYEYQEQEDYDDEDYYENKDYDYEEYYVVKK